MMATRDDLLRELGLLPQWRLRSHAGLGAAAVAPRVAADAANAVADAASTEAVAASAVADAASAVAVAASAVAVAASAAAVANPPADRVRAAVPLDGPAEQEARRDRIAALEWPTFAADVDACTACKLCKNRNRSVPGVGDTHAQWLFVGEAPGGEEDAKGEPFVGQAGRLLDNMLAALGIARGDRVYIANVLKCRPPGNRTPEPQEVDACLPYLDRQIALIRPGLIVALGKSAATALLQVDATIASLRGRVHRYRDVPLVVTYHPAYLLRNLPDKAKAWEDLLLARRTAGDRRSPG